MPQGFRKAGEQVLGQWQNFIPRGPDGQPMGHGGGIGDTLNFVQSREISAKDETGRLSLGPQGFNLQAGQRADDPGWSMSLGPGSASYQRGGLGVGGTWSRINPSGYVQLGPVRLSGGYGMAPGATSVPGGTEQQRRHQGGWGEASFQGYQEAVSRGMASSPNKPGGWGQISFQAGGPAPQMMAPDVAGQLDAAVAPWATPQQEVPLPSAREEMNAQLERRRREDPNWWRP